MADTPPRILVVEDVFFIAAALEDRLTEIGYACVGPAFDLKSAIELVRTEAIDAAILDMRLGEDSVDVVADMLAARGIPFAFATGDTTAVADRWQDRMSLIKPYSDHELGAVLRQLVSK